MKVEISNGELLDKLSILELKISNINDDKKLINIKNEHNGLSPLCDNLFNHFGDELRNLYSKLSSINSELWKIEDDIRECESKNSFDENFIELARSVYKTNDLRFEIKSKINEHFGSSIIEQKELKKY